MGGATSAAHAQKPERFHHALPPPLRSPGKPTSAAELSGCWRDHERAGRPTLPHFPSGSRGSTYSHTGGCGQGSPTSNPQFPKRGSHWGSARAGWPRSPGQNATVTALHRKVPQPGIRLEPNHSGQYHTPLPFPASTPSPDLYPLNRSKHLPFVRDPGILSPQSANFLDTPPHYTPIQS